MKFDFSNIIEDKRALRRRLAALPVAEKLDLLDALRERALDLRRAGARAVPGDALETPQLERPEDRIT